MFKPTFLKSLLALAMLAFVFTACTDEVVAPTEDTAFSSNDERGTVTVKLTNGKANWSDNGVYYLRIVSDEKVRSIFIKSSKTGGVFKRVDPKNGAFGKGSFDADAFLRNKAGLFNSEKTGFSVFQQGPNVFVHDGKKFGVLRVDSGEVFREGGKGTLPEGISCLDYLPFKSTADFRGSGIFIGVTEGGYVAAARKLSDTFQIPGIELGTPNSSSDVNYNSKTAGQVSCLEVTGWKRVIFTLENGKKIGGFAQRGGNEFIKVDNNYTK